MSPVTVVTDTTTYIPRELSDSLGIHQIPLYVGWGGDMRREDTYDDLGAFYERLRDSETLPKTSQPSVGDFIELYEPILASGSDIASIHIAGGLSGTCESAREAARTLAERNLGGTIEVIDAETGAGGLGCVVIAAATAAGRGAALTDVVEEARRARGSLEMWFCLDTLEYLKRGGRIGGAQALLGSALRIKPILTFGTEITPVDRVRTRSKAIARMESYLDQLHDSGKTEWIVQHAQSADDAARLVEYGTGVFGTKPLFCTQVGPVLGAHLGSGMLVGGYVRAPQ